MSDSPDFQFHRDRKKKDKEKVEDLHVWVKGIFDSDDVVTPKKSAWAFVYIDSKKDVVFVSGEGGESNNDRLQLIPIIEFLEWISGDKCKRLITFYTSNNYIANVLNEWVDKWRKSDFKLPEGTDRPNADLLRKIDSLCLNHTSLIIKHQFSTNEFTEKVDSLCHTELNRS